MARAPGHFRPHFSQRFCLVLTLHQATWAQKIKAVDPLERKHVAALRLAQRQRRAKAFEGQLCAAFESVLLV